MSIKVFTTDDIRQAGIMLEPLVCKYCSSTEMTFHQYIQGGKGHCATCGKWQ